MPRHGQIMTHGADSAFLSSPLGSIRRMALTKIDKSDARYPSLTRGNNPRWQGTPKHVYLPADAGEVKEAFDKIQKDKEKFAARGGGHCYINSVDRADENYSVIDMGLLNQVQYDQVHGAISIDAGARLGEVYKYLFRRWGVTLPGGSCGTVGIGGHVLGGGYGLLSRLYGVTVDWLYGVEVITKDGEPKTVTRDSLDDDDKDLFWAHTGGGGGNFALVTRFLFRSSHPSIDGSDPTTCLPKAPSRVQLMTLKLPWKKTGGSENQWLNDLTKNFTTWCEKNAYTTPEQSKGTDRLFGLFRVKTPGSTAENHALHLTVQVAELADDYGSWWAENILEEFRKSVQIDEAKKAHGKEGVVDFTENLPWLDATQDLSGGDWADRAKQKSAYHLTFTDHHRNTMLRLWENPEIEGFGDEQKPGRGALAQLDTYGAAVNRVDWESTAYSHRDSAVKIQYQAYWSAPDDAQDAEHLDWLNRAYAEIYDNDYLGEPLPAHDSPTNADGPPDTDGCFVNYLDDDLAALDYEQLYWGPKTLQRLKRIKRDQDGGGVFTSAQPIHPAPKP